MSSSLAQECYCCPYWLSWLQLRKSEVSWGENLTPEVLAERSAAARPACRSAAQPRISKVLLRSGKLWENTKVSGRFLNWQSPKLMKLRLKLTKSLLPDWRPLCYKCEAPSVMWNHCCAFGRARSHPSSSIHSAVRAGWCGDRTSICRDKLFCCIDTGN